MPYQGTRPITSHSGHNRKLVLGAVSLTKTKPNRHDIAAMTEVRDELEAVMVAEKYLSKAPFKWVGIVFRYGLKNEEEPHYEAINRSHGDLPVAMGLDAVKLHDAGWEELKNIFMIATLKILIHAGKKYNLPTEVLSELLDRQLSEDQTKPEK